MELYCWIVGKAWIIFWLLIPTTTMNSLVEVILYYYKLSCVCYFVLTNEKSRWKVVQWTLKHWTGVLVWSCHVLWQQTTIVSKSDYLYVSLIAVSQLTLTDRFNMQDIFCDYLIQMKIVWVHLCLGFVVIKYYHHTFEDKCWLSIQLINQAVSM